MLEEFWDQVFLCSNFRSFFVVVITKLILLTSITSCMFQVLSGVALWSYKVAKAPKDKEHPYGHSLFVPTSYSIDLIMHI